MFSCQRLSVEIASNNDTQPEEQTAPSENNQPLYFTAGIEQSSLTRATLNSSHQTLWSSGDQLGIYVRNNDDSWKTIAPSNLVSGAGTATGSFTMPLWDASDNNNVYSSSENKWNVAAVFPYNTGQTITTAGDVTFNLPTEYSGYVTGRSLLPLLANMSTDGDNPNPTSLTLYHVGAGVQISVKDVPAIANSIRLKVDGQKITGAFASVKNYNAGTAQLTSSESNTDNQSVKLTFGTNNAGDYDFIFPIPAVTTPTLIFDLLDENGLIIWSAKASNQESIGRANLMNFEDPITVDDTKIASKVLKKNDFYLVGWNLDDKNTEYTGTGYHFNTSGNLATTVGGDSYGDVWAYVKCNGNDYKAYGKALPYTKYVDIPFDRFSSDFRIILNNDDNGSETNNLLLTYGETDYFVIAEGSSLSSVTLDKSSYDIPSHENRVRVWILDHTGYAKLKVHNYNDSNSTTWPGDETTACTLNPTHVKLSPGYAPNDKVFIPKGSRTYTLAYNSDGTLTLSY